MAQHQYQEAMRHVTAKNPKHQSLVNRAVQWDTKYELANTERELASNNTECDYEEEDKLWRKWDKQCEKAYDKFLEYMEELPKGEQKNIENNLKH